MLVCIRPQCLADGDGRSFLSRSCRLPIHKGTVLDFEINFFYSPQQPGSVCPNLNHRQSPTIAHLRLVFPHKHFAHSCLVLGCTHAGSLGQKVVLMAPGLKGGDGLRCLIGSPSTVALIRPALNKGPVAGQDE